MRVNTGPPALAAPNQSFVPEFPPPPPITALWRILQRFVIWGRLPDPRTDKGALAQSATVFVPPDVPHI